MQGKLAVRTGQCSVSDKEQCEGWCRLTLKGVDTGLVSLDQYLGGGEGSGEGLVQDH